MAELPGTQSTSSTSDHNKSSGEVVSLNEQTQIGQSTYISVFRARDLESGKIVALKKVRFDNFVSQSSGQGRQQYVVFSTQHNSSSAGPVSAFLTPGGGELVSAPATFTNTSLQLTSIGDEHPQHMPSSVQSNRLSASSSGSFILPTGLGTSNDNRSYVSQSSLSNLDRAGPSELQSFSDTWKSRFSAMSMKYKESISKSTRGLKEKLFSRSSQMADIGSEVRSEVNAGIAIVSRMMEHLEIRDNNRAGCIPLANSPVESSVTARRNNDDMNMHNEAPSDNNNSAAFATSSVSH